MSFGKKLKQLREEKGLTQTELAEVLGTSLKTISNYEVKGTRPRRMDMYEKIADYFQVDINYLLTEGSSFIISAGSQYGYQGARDAEKLLSSMAGLFAGGELPEEDKDALFEAIQEAYWEAKLENKKYGKKKE
ncbi:helix-turn-helix domain-containing protein [Facklamia sp. P12932]|uniref:helix-turn-helix domain-containing protein n=1 Tax=Facklamia sp. P12932 TaxID=3421947 RepID=UPI003D186BC6